MKKSKGPLWPRFIKRFYGIRFYGINGELDEYREQEVNRIGNKLFILLFLFEFISTTLTFLLSTVWKVSAEIFLYCNAFVIIFVMPMVMMTMLTNRDLQGPLEVPRDKLEKERQKAKKKGWLSGVVFAIFMLVFNMFSKWQEGENPFEILFNPLFLIIFIFSGFIFGAVMGSMAASQIDPEKDQHSFYKSANF